MRGAYITSEGRITHEVRITFRARNTSLKKALLTQCFFLARPKGLEPPTYWFVASHSIQLS